MEHVRKNAVHGNAFIITRVKNELYDSFYSNVPEIKFEEEIPQCVAIRIKISGCDKYDSS